MSSSGLGRSCLRQIQYDYIAVPKDPGREFEPRTLRVFEAGHRAEEIVAGWLRLAGFDLRTEGIRWLAVRLLYARRPVQGPYRRLPARRSRPHRLPRRSGRTRPSAQSSWKEVVKRGVTLSKPIYAAQIALYQAYLELPLPALFTALNRDTLELYCEMVPFDAALAQLMSDKRGRRGARLGTSVSFCPAPRRSGLPSSAAAALAPGNGTGSLPRGRTAAGEVAHDPRCIRTEAS